MTAQRRPVFNPENPTIPAAAVRTGPPVAAAAVVRNSAIAIRTVPTVYDAADDGDDLHATQLFNPGAPTAGASPNRNFGGTALMPAAFSIEMRDAIMSSLKDLEAQQPIQRPDTPVEISPSASGLRTKFERPVERDIEVESQVERPGEDPPAPVPHHTMGLSSFEIGFAVSAAVIVGLSAALLFVYFL